MFLKILSEIRNSNCATKVNPNSYKIPKNSLQSKFNLKTIEFVMKFSIMIVKFKKHCDHMLEFSAIFPSVDRISRIFFSRTYISSMNCKLSAKKFTPMHKLSCKSEQLIPPAQHPMCSALLNKFIFFSSRFARFRRREEKKKLWRNEEQREKILRLENENMLRV